MRIFTVDGSLSSKWVNPLNCALFVRKVKLIRHIFCSKIPIKTSRNEASATLIAAFHSSVNNMALIVVCIYERRKCDKAVRITHQMESFLFFLLCIKCCMRGNGDVCVIVISPCWQSSLHFWSSPFFSARIRSSRSSHNETITDHAFSASSSWTIQPMQCTFNIRISPGFAIATQSALLNTDDCTDLMLVSINRRRSRRLQADRAPFCSRS